MALLWWSGITLDTPMNQIGEVYIVLFLLLAILVYLVLQFFKEIKH